MQDIEFVAVAIHAEMAEFLRQAFPLDNVREPTVGDRALVNAYATAITAPQMIAEARAGGFNEVYLYVVGRRDEAQALIDKADHKFMGVYVAVLVSQVQALSNRYVPQFVEAVKQQTRLALLGELDPVGAAPASQSYRAANGPERLAALRRLIATELAVNLADLAGDRKSAVVRAAKSTAAKAEEALGVAAFIEAVMHNRKQWEKRVATWRGAKGATPIPDNLKIV